MKRPLNLAENLQKKFLSYIETDFWALNGHFQNARKRLLLDIDKKAIFQQPWFEIIKPYKSSEVKINDLNSEHFNNQLNDEELIFFKNLVQSGLIGENIQLYAHQLKMIQEYWNGKNLVITTGTGSGKTESFLLPLFSYLSKYYLKKTPLTPQEANLTNNSDPAHAWFKNFQLGNNGKKIFTPILHRHQDRENACVKAIIFYPMNALVADQMNRLRAALASTGALNLFRDENRGRLYFGKYNSTLKVARYNRNRLLSNKSEIADEIDKIYESYNALSLKAKNNPTDKKVQELFSSTPNPFGSELLNRWDMQQTPPDILITNYSMLNVLMMREEEDSFFTETRNWLESDNTNNIFHLIIDELHLNRGTAGAEVSWLLRLYLHRLGLRPGHPQLRIMASSASLDGDGSQKFLEDFFGYGEGQCDQHFKIISDEYEITPEVDQPILSDDSLLMAYEYLPDKNYERGRPEEMVNEVFGADNLNIFLDTIKTEINSKLNEAYCDNSRKTISKDELANNLFPAVSDENKERCLESFFYIRSLYDGGMEGRKLSRLRMHLLYNNLPGLYSQMDSLSELTNDSFRLIQNNRRLAQLLVCYECGTLLFGGYRHTIQTPDGNEYEMLPIPKNLDAAPDSYSQTIPDFMNYDEFVIFWPNSLNGKNLNPDAEGPFDTAKFGGNVANGGIWVIASLNPANGRIKEEAPIHGWVEGFLFKQRVANAPEMKALPSKCPCCAQHQHHNSERTSSFRHFSTPHNKTTQVLTTQLLKELSDNPEDRKLIVFSDSRNSAAKLSAQLEQDNYWDSMRKIIAFIGRYNEEDNIIIQRINNINGLSWNQIEDEIKDFIIGRGVIDGSILRAIEIMPDDAELCQKIIINRFNNYFNQNIYNNFRVSISDNILPNNNATNLLLKRLLKKGIAPMGNTFKVDQINIREFNSENNNKIKWDELYDLHNGNYSGVSGSQGQSDIINLTLKKEFTRGLFGRNRFSVEMMSKGYVAFKQADIDSLCAELDIVDDIEKTKLEEVANTFIRIMGYKFRSIAHSSIIQTNLINIGNLPINHALRKYLNRAYPNQNHIHQLILNKIINFGAQANNFIGIIDPKDFDLILATENSEVYICHNCQTPHLHKSGGICAHCFSDISDVNSVSAGTLWSSNYYTQNPEEDIVRLHCEELTGQTDDFEKRQRLFKNLYLGNEDPLAEQIDVISATTTMEVGIDIGSLSATLMGNMAPERFNYQQRVGRAGRGGQAFSVALTVCRSSSHDAFYYHHPDSMLNQKPPVPFIPVNLPDIKERFYYKELLRLVSMNPMAVPDNPNAEEEDFNTPLAEQLNEKDIHGCLGNTEEFRQNHNNFQDNIFTSITGQLLSDQFSSWANVLGINKNFVEIRNRLVEVTNTSPLPSGLATALAENGVLPMYGMPTNVRIAYLRGGGTVDRDAELAMIEFSPKAELLKDKKYYEMEGITSPRYKLGNQLMNNPVSDQFNTFVYSVQPDQTIQQENMDAGIAPGHTRAIIPKAYYSINERYETNNNKERHQLSLPKLNNCDVPEAQSINGTNLKVSCFNGSYFVFNDNRGNLFNFYENNYRVGNNINYNQWSLNQQGGNPVGAFSLAKKTFTNLVEISPIQLMEGLSFGLGLDNYRNTAIQAAAYSAAFILRNVYTTDKDIDGEEIRILKLLQNNQDQQLNIVYADQLANGSGFCRDLSNNIEKYLNLCFDRNNPFAGRILSDQNLSCDTASYQNLMNFRNQKFHPILDWRLGITYLRMLKGGEQSKNSILMADDQLHEFKSFNGQNSWIEGFRRLFQEWVETTALGNYHEAGDAGIPICERNGTYIIGIHPLWNTVNPGESLAALVNELGGQNQIKYMDSFNILRRPGACYAALF
jgi:DEAD/DEAH box helicase domain-containing protein